MTDEAPWGGKRVAETHITGNRGLAQATLDFLRLGWGPVPNHGEDAGSGIDMIVWARDDRRTELGVPVTAQVKGGRSHFTEPAEVEGRSGWYFRVDDRTLELWVSQPVAPLVVLCDLETETSYWVHVTREAAISTGEQWKILVPSNQRIEEASRSALEAVARSATVQASGFSGSAWAPPSLGEEDKWRCALVAPRLVAPHPNLGHGGGLTPVQGVALVVAGRTHDYVRFAEAHQEIPSLTDAAEHESSQWRFVWALHAWFSRRDLAPLTRAVADASTSHELAAAVVATVSALVEDEDFEEAERLLDDALAREVLGKEVDRCWLLVQKARVLGELGRGFEAVGCALDAYTRLRDARGIPATATRAAAVGAWWRLAGAWSGWTGVDADEEARQEQDDDGTQEHERPGIGATLGLEDVIVGTDTHVAWWRAQMLSGALSHYLRDDFLEWSQANLHRVGLYDESRAGLQAATTAASYAGDAGSVAASGCSLARYDMVVATSEDEVHRALNDLRRLGDEEAVKHGATHLWQRGPLGALRAASRSLLEERRWSRSCCLVNLRLWQIGADLLTESEADDAIGFCRAAFGDPRHPFSARARAGFHQGDELIETIAELARVASDQTQSELAEWFASVCEDEPLDGLREMAAARLLRSVRWDVVHDAVRRQWMEWATARDIRDPAATTLLAELAKTTDEASDALLERAEAGNLVALIRGWPDDREIPVAIAAPLVAKLSAHLDKRIAEMEQHTYEWEGQDRALQLAWLNVRCPEAADWDVVTRYLLHPAVSVDDKSSTCRYLASPEAVIPDEVARRLAEGADALVTGAEAFFGPDEGSLRSAAVALRHKLGAVAGRELALDVVKLVSSRSSADRSVAARTVRDVEDSSLSGHVVLPLLGDEDTHVAIAAATCVARRACLAPSDRVLQVGLVATLEVPGAALASAALGWVDTSRGLTDEVMDAIRAAAASHPSASVRRRSKKLMADLAMLQDSPGAPVA